MIAEKNAMSDEIERRQTVEPSLRTAVEALHALSPQKRSTAIELIRRLAESEGISVPVGPSQGLQAPTEGIPLWVAKLKSERYSERTIHMYRYRAERYLERDPLPTKLSIQRYLAERLEAVSPATVGNEQKALKSLFTFLQEEGLWLDNPMAKIKHIKVRYAEKQPPTSEDVLKVLGIDFWRRGDGEKFAMQVLLLATTGLRISEAAGVLKQDVDLDRGEVWVTGKGEKRRVVPLLPVTASALGGYIERHPSKSPYLFPGDTRTGHASIHNFEKTLRHACKRAGVVGFTPHQLRHFFATELLRDGAKLEVVSRILGHAGVGITADIYRHVRTGEMRDEVLAHGPLNGVKRLPAPKGRVNVALDSDK